MKPRKPRKSERRFQIAANFDPFALKPQTYFYPDIGLTYAELLEKIPDLPDWFAEFGTIREDGKVIGRRSWKKRKPKWPCTITLHPPHLAGGGRSGKQIGLLVATIALIGATAFVGAGGIAAVLGLPATSTFAAGGAGAALAAAGLGAAGSLALQALAPPPIKANDQGADTASQAGIGANVIRPLEFLSSVIGGAIRYSPYLVTEPYIEFKDGIKTVHAIYGIAGRFLIENVQINGTAASEYPEITIETREGSGGDAPLTVQAASKIVVQNNLNQELAGFKLELQANKNDKLLHQDDPTRDTPKDIILRSDGDADEFWIKVLFPGGISNTGGDTTAVPMRVEIRRKGDVTWKKLPTLFWQDPKLGKPLEQQIRLLWRAPGDDVGLVNVHQDFAALAAFQLTNDTEAFEYESEAYFINSSTVAHPQPWTGNTNGALTVSASSNSANAWLALDNSGGITEWESSTDANEWWKMDFGSGTIIKGIWITTGSGGADTEYDPRDFRIEGSNDDTNWTVLGTYSSQDFSQYFAESGSTFYGRSYTIPEANQASYRYYRIFITANNGGTTIRIPSIALYSTDPPFNGLGTSRNFAKYVSVTPDGFDIYLKPATFPKGEYEVKIKRGLAFDTDNMLYLGYAWSGNPANFFDYETVSGQHQVRIGQRNYSSQTYIESFSTVENSSPLNVAGKGIALIGLEAPEVVVRSLSADFTRKTDIVSGGDWLHGNPAANNNPAAQFRHVCIGSDNPEAAPGEIVDEVTLATWYSECVTKGYEVNSVIDGYTVAQVLQEIAAAGYATPRVSDFISVIRERDRSGDLIRQTFSPFNVRRFTLGLEFPRRPRAIRAEFYDRAEDNALRTAPLVYMDGYDASNVGSEIHSIRYNGFTDEAKVMDRALFDLRQSYLRKRTISFEVPHEGLVSDAGDLVAVSFDMLNRFKDEARVRGYRFAGTAEAPTVAAILLKSPVDLDKMQENIGESGDFGDIIIECGVWLTLLDGSILTGEILERGKTRTLTFKTPPAVPTRVDSKGQTVSALGKDMICCVGALSKEVDRMVIKGIEYAGGMIRAVTCVDEAPGLFA